MLPSLLLFARAPVAGRVKTRLVPHLTDDGAARLYRAFLEDAARGYLAPGRWDSIVAVDPDPDDPQLAGLFPAPWVRQAQAPGGLGERLASAFLERFAEGAPFVVAMGSDHPTLPRRLLEEAFGRLALGNGAAVVPAEDGGYCAIGLACSVPVAEVFREVPWSSPSVLAITLRRLRRARVRVAVLESAYDVDRPEDIGRLRRDLAFRDPAAPDYPRATARALETLE